MVSYFLTLNSFYKLTFKYIDMSEKNSGSGFAFVAGLAVGAAVGALAGLLFAPETGEDTRKKLGDKSKELADDLYDKFDDLKDSMTDLMEDVKESTAETLETVKNSANTLLEEAKAKSK